MYLKMKEEIKEAMKSKDTIKRDCLKMVIGKAKSIKKEKYPNDTEDIVANDIIVQAVQSEIKQLNQTLEALKGQELCNLHKETTLKMSILSAYLPKMMSEDEVAEAVTNILLRNKCNSFGMMMKVVMAELKGKADNKVIKSTVERFNKAIDELNNVLLN